MTNNPAAPSRKQPWVALAVVLAASGIAVYTCWQHATGPVSPTPAPAPLKSLAVSRTLTGPLHRYHSVAFYTKGGQLIALDERGALQYWDVKTARVTYTSFPRTASWRRGAAWVRPFTRVRGQDRPHQLRATVLAVGAPAGLAPTLLPLGLTAHLLDRVHRQAAWERRRVLIQAGLLFGPLSERAAALALPPQELDQLVPPDPDLWLTASYFFGPWHVVGDRDQPGVVMMFSLLYPPDPSALTTRSEARRQELFWCELAHLGEDYHESEPTATFWLFGELLWHINFSRDGTRLLLSGRDKSWYLLEKKPGPNWDYDQRKLTFAPEAGLTPLALLPDGKHILAHDAARAVGIWEADTGKQLRALAGSEYRESPFGLSPDGQRLAVCDGTDVVVWDLGTGQPESRLLGLGKRTEQLVFAPNGRLLLSAGAGPLRIWDVDTGRERYRLVYEGEAPASVAFAPDGRQVAAAVGREILIWNLPAD